MKLAILCSLLVLFAIGCGPSRAVSLSGTWPAEAGAIDDYLAITERWTRHERVRAGLSEHLVEIVNVHATLLAPEWRAAYVHKRSRDELLSPARSQGLLAAQRAQDAAFYEVMLLVSANERRLIDFHRGDRSLWRVVLSDGRGNEIEAEEIVRDRRLRSVIAEFFPAIGDFDYPYIARFPRELELFGPGATRIELRMSTPRAAVRLVWEDEA